MLSCNNLLCYEWYVHYKVFSFFNVVSSRVMFQMVVSPVVSSSAPDKVKISLGRTTFQNIKSHVIWFSCFGNHCISDESSRGRIVCCDRCLGLWMPHLFQHDSHRGRCLEIVKQFSSFCFGSWGHDMFDDLGKGQDGSIVKGFIVESTWI